MHFNKVLIFGVGLIGASFARGLKAAHAASEIIGFGRTPKSLKVAYDLGIIDEVGINPGADVREADLILVATPVGQMPEIFQRIAPYLGDQAYAGWHAYTCPDGDGWMERSGHGAEVRALVS